MYRLPNCLELSTSCWWWHRHILFYCHHFQCSHIFKPASLYLHCSVINPDLWEPKCKRLAQQVSMLHLEDVLIDAHCHTQLSPRLWGLLCLHWPRLRQFQKLLNDISHCLRILLTRDWWDLGFHLLQRQSLKDRGLEHSNIFIKNATSKLNTNYIKGTPSLMASKATASQKLRCNSSVISVKCNVGS